MRLRTAAALVVAIVAALGGVAGCGGSDDPAVADRSARPTASSAPASTPPTVSSDPVPSYDPQARIPVGRETAPQDFPGDDEEFLARFEELLPQLDAEAPADEEQIVVFGREFCGLLSGGGAVADKYDFYAGQRNLVEPGWTAALLAAINVYCPELGDGYLADRAAHPPMTPAEQLDLVRYLIRGSTGTEAQLSDARLARVSARVCGQLERDAEGFVAGLDPKVPDDRALLVLVAAASIAYCPELDLDLETLIGGTA